MVHVLAGITVAADSECDAPCLSKYELTSSPVNERHDLSVHLIIRKPRCFATTSGRPHSGFGHLLALRTRPSCVHMGVLLATQR